MRVIDLDQIDDEEERKKVLESYQNKMQDMQNERKSYLQQTGLDKIYSGDYSNSSDGFNTAGRNDFSVKPSIWDQIKTTASNMLGNTGYGLANGLIGFAQNEKRNQTAQKSLNMLSNISTLGTTSMLGNLGKSIQSTLDFAFKNNDKYNSLKKTYEDNKNNISNAIDEKLQKQEDINKENIQKNIIETTNPVGEKLVEIAPSLGQMLPSMIPGIGTLYSVGSANDSYYDEAKSRGMNDEQASNYSQLMGGVEGLTEQIGIGKLVKGGKGIAKGTVKEAFKDFGIGVADNFIQEAVIEPISEGVTKATAGDEYLKNDYRTSEGWKNLGKDMLQSGFDGAITAGIMGGVSAGLGKSINVYNKLKNGQQPTLEEYKSAYTEQRENGIDVDGIVQAEFKSRMNQSRQNDNKVTNTNNVNTQTNTQQDIANRLNEIVQNDKYISSEDKQAMIEATNNLASKNQLDSNNTLDAINQIKQMSQLSQEQNDQLDTGKKYLSGRKEIYNKYRNVTDYDNTIVQQAKNTVAQNKQGKRTKEQWLDVAKYIGTNIADRPNSEIQKIAYKSWQDETPNNSATLNKQGQKYVKFMSDDWIDTIYDSVEKQRQKSGYVANNDTVNALDNLYNEYTNNQTVQNNNIQNNIDTSKMNLVDSAKAYNLNGNDETIQSINQKLNDRGIASRFDGNLFKNADGTPNKNINALWRTTTDENGNTHREIVFNPYVDGDINEQKTMQQVTIHEMLHDMAGDEKVKKDLFNLVLEKNKTRDGYSDARSNLDEMYSQVYDKNSKDFKDLVDEEEVADTLAQKLGDQDFINSLNKEKPNVFKRIYDWVVDKLNKFTGSKNEKIYWEDVKNKFESAYRQDYQGNGNIQSKYSFVGEKGLNNGMKQDTQFIQVERGLNKAKQMKEKGIDNETIRQNTNWFQDKNGDWKFEISDKNMRIKKNLKIKDNTTYRLGDIIEHENLFIMYPELKNIKINFKNDKNISGNYKNNMITLNKELINNKARIESTLIHEIQHAIQETEGFETGITSRLSKKAYYENLGEIEADDVSQRFIKEKYKNESLKNTIPESSKKNPKHRKYNTYVKNRGVIDKIKDGVFKYPKKDGNNDEIYQKDMEQTNKATLQNNDKQIWNRLNKNSVIDTQGAWQSFLENQIGPTEKGKTVQELRLPTKETINNKKVDAYNVLYQDNKQTIKTNLPISEGGKTRKHYKSIMQSSNTSPEAKEIAKELIGSDTYVPDSNKRQLETADNRIMSNGADNESVTLATKVKNNDKITADDIAVGERLIEYYSKTGEKEKLQDAIQNVALAGTQAGQTVQAMSLINRQTPQGQAVYLSKVVDRMNKKIEKRTKGKGQKFNLTPEMLDKITNSNKENLEKNIDEVARELAKQVPKTTMEKIDSWRYFSMLANPRTHIRNIIGNLSMASVQKVKNKVAGGLEAIAQKTGMIDERTKTLKPASRGVKKFAKADVENVLGRLNNESKFDTKNLIQQYQRTFKSNVLENTLGKLYNLNSKALEAEDTFGLKSAYRKAMADYMTANKLTEKDLTAGTKEADTKLENARKYAIEQAQEATFHQYSSIASLLNTLENKNKATRLLTGAIIPFKKTPINVAKTGIDYSPIGIVKAFTTDIAKLRKGDINANQYIDNLAKGLTGTGITVAGYALAQAGILSASGDDDDQKNQYYQEDRGNQSFSLKIGDKTYSLDWLSPTAIPLFIGAQLNDNVKSSGEEQTTEDMLDKISNSIDAMSSAMNPMIEMSMLSGVASAVKSFAQGDAQFFQNLLINSAKSYVNQFFPTLGGQVAKMVDDTERSTTSTKKNMFSKAVDSTGKQILNKIPFASKLLPAKTDVWGNEVKRESNKLYRALQQAVFPWTEKKLKSTVVDNAISDLYEKTGDNSVLPNTSINKDFTINSEKYRLTAEEYANYKKEYGKTSYTLLNRLTNSNEYKNMTDEQKSKAIAEVYSYANEKNKMDYADKNNIKDVKVSTAFDTIDEIKTAGGNEADYFKYVGSTVGLEKQDEKMDALIKMNVSGKSKSAIYKTIFGKKDDVYNNVLSKNGIDINEYLKYKNQEFKSDKEDDGTLQGKSVTNSKRNKVFNYVNSMNISYENRLVLLGQQYKLDSQKRKDLFNYINNTDINVDEKLKIFDKMQGFTVYKDGTVEY